MSDRKGIFFGAIDPSNATHLVPSSINKERDDGDMIKARGGNVNVSEIVEKEVLELSETSKLAQEKHAQLLRRVEAERRARNIVVPTSIEEVVLRLRELNQPITLFGEGPADRRERLRENLSRLELQVEETGVVNRILDDIKSQSAGALPAGPTGTLEEQQTQLFYIPIKNKSLKHARAAIFDFSIKRASDRLLKEKQEKVMSSEVLNRIDRYAAELYSTAGKMINVASQNGDVRPISCVRYSPDSAHIATGSWSSSVKVWDSSNLSEIKIFRGHEDRVTGLDWHPTIGFSEMSDHSDIVCLCTGGADNTAILWSATRENPLAFLKGHQARLGDVKFHPTGNYVGTTSFDHSWRLWDVTTEQELLLQEGHYKEVYAIAFHPDGSLVATGDLNGIGRVWDLRSGKAILPLQGHSKQILCMDFSLNGYTLASGSDDRTVRIWDLRQRKCSYVIPAHNGMVSEVKFSPKSNELLLTASYDETIRLWRARDWKHMASLKGHEGKVMSADFSRDEKHIVSCGFDRTFKTWAHEDEF
jgi:U4/U6 small nuclear ribonucleoprotein PRP4